MPKTKASVTTPSPDSQNNVKPEPAKVSKGPTQIFVTMALDMSWRLAIVVLLPIVAGFKLDEKFGMTPLLTITGFFLAMAGTGLVMWRTMQEANRVPVPKKENK